MNNNYTIIGTRDSELAKWQALSVSNFLANAGHKNELHFIKSEGDLNLTQPLYQMGVQGVFTKSLDAALLEKKIDIAVHSYKDVPTQLAQGLIIAAVLKRANPFDVLITKEYWDDTTPYLPHTIATSSIRRKAQWLNRYPNAAIENIRGNVNTRLKTLQHSNWHGAIFAAAGLHRLNIQPVFSHTLTWMLPAPAQGAIVIVCRREDEAVYKKCRELNCREAELCTSIEKDFLKILMGGCSTPIGAYAHIINEQVFFQGNILSEDGKQIITVELNEPLTAGSNMGSLAAKEILAKGGEVILKQFRKQIA